MNRFSDGHIPPIAPVNDVTAVDGAIPFVDAASGKFLYSDNLTFDGTNIRVGGSAGATISGDAGIMTLAGLDGNAENLTLDFAGVVNRVTVDSDSGASAISLPGMDFLFIAHNVKHSGDGNTYWELLVDNQRWFSGGEEFLRMIEATEDEFWVNPAYSGVDFVASGDTANFDIIRTDAANDAIGLYDVTPVAQQSLTTDLTNNMGGGSADGDLEDITSGGLTQVSESAIQNNFIELLTEIEALKTIVANIGIAV